MNFKLKLPWHATANHLESVTTICAITVVSLKSIFMLAILLSLDLQTVCFPNETLHALVFTPADTHSHMKAPRFHCPNSIR